MITYERHFITFSMKDVHDQDKVSQMRMVCGQPEFLPAYSAFEAIVNKCQEFLLGLNDYHDNDERN